MTIALVSSTVRRLRRTREARSDFAQPESSAHDALPVKKYSGIEAGYPFRSVTAVESL